MQTNCKSGVWLWLLTALLATKALGGGHTVGSGGEAFESRQGPLQVLDAMEYQNEFIPAELPAYQQQIKFRFESLARKLPKTAAYLTRFLTKIPGPRWYFSQYRLRQVEDRGATPIILTEYLKHQIAVNLGDEVFIQALLWQHLPLNDQAFLLVHESLWNAVGRANVTNSNVIRKLTGRLLSRYHYLVTPEELAGDLKASLRNPASPLFKVIDSDLADLSSNPLAPADNNLDAFLDFCQGGASAADRRTLQLMGLFSTGNSGMEMTRDNCSYVFRYYKGISRVQFNNERIESITPFRFFNQLIELELKNNRISDLSAISGMKNLRKLSLSRNQVRSVSGLGRLDNLRDLDLSNNQIEDFSQLVGPQLETLNLSGNFIGDNLGNFPKLPNLAILDLSRNQISRLDGLVLTNTPALKELRLAHNAVVNIGRVDQFAGLVILDLSDNSLYSVKGLAEVLDIDELNLSGNKISSLEMVDLPQSLTSLNIGRNPLKSVISNPNGQTSLRVFIARETGLDSLTFLAGSSFSSLEILDVAGNGISVFSVPTSVAAKLRVLDVSDNQLASIDGIRKFPYLSYLNLEGNRPLYAFEGGPAGDVRNIIGQRLFDLGYLYDLEELVVSDRATSGLTTCGNGVMICPLMHLVKPHRNHLGETIALKVHFESIRD